MKPHAINLLQKQEVICNMHAYDNGLAELAGRAETCRLCAWHAKQAQQREAYAIDGHVAVKKPAASTMAKSAIRQAEVVQSYWQGDQHTGSEGALQLLSLLQGSQR